MATYMSFSLDSESEEIPTVLNLEPPMGRRSSDSEMWHLKFRSFMSSESLDPVEHLRQLSELCHQWLRPDLNTMEEILDQLVLEQFLISTTPNIQVIIKESGVTSCKELEKILRTRREPKRWSAITFQGQTVLVPNCRRQEFRAQASAWDNGMETFSEHHSFESKKHLQGYQASPGPQSLTGTWAPSADQPEPFPEGVCLDLRLKRTPKKNPPKKKEEATVLTPQKAQLPQSLDPAGEDNQKASSKETDVHNNSCSFCVRNSFPTSQDWPVNLNNMKYSEQKEMKSHLTSQDGASRVDNMDTSGQGELESHLTSQDGASRVDNMDTSGQGELESHLTSQDGASRVDNMDTSGQGELESHLTSQDGASRVDNTNSPGQDGQGHDPASPAEPVHLPVKQKSRKKNKIKCSFCPMTFGYKSHWNLHQRSHTGEKPYKCTVCKKGFSQSSDLRVHHRIHTGEKPYVCSICKKAFTHESTLLGHHRVHTKEKPYKCSTCEKRFSHRGNLNVHMRIHSNSRPYECEKCTQSFRQLGTFKRHEKTHMPKTPELAPQAGSLPQNKQLEMNTNTN